MEMKQIYKFKKDYTDIINEFQKLKPLEKELEIEGERKIMRMNGIEESGTRDIHNAIVELYRSYGTFEEFFEKEVEFQHARYYSEL